MKGDGRQWDVDPQGRARLTVPGIPTATTELVSSATMDRSIEQIQRQKARWQSRLDQAQERVDELAEQEADLLALRASVTAEP